MSGGRCWNPRQGCQRQWASPGHTKCSDAAEVPAGPVCGRRRWLVPFPSPDPAVRGPLWYLLRSGSVLGLGGGSEGSTPLSPGGGEGQVYPTPSFGSRVAVISVDTSSSTRKLGTRRPPPDQGQALLCQGRGRGRTPACVPAEDGLLTRVLSHTPSACPFLEAGRSPKSVAKQL